MRIARDSILLAGFMLITMTMLAPRTSRTPIRAIDRVKREVYIYKDAGGGEWYMTKSGCLKSRTPSIASKLPGIYKEHDICK